MGNNLAMSRHCPPRSRPARYGAMGARVRAACRSLSRLAFPRRLRLDRRLLWSAQHHRWKGYEQKLVAVDPKQRFNTSTDCLRKRLVLHHFGLVAAGRINSIAVADTHFSAGHSAFRHNPLRGELNPALPRRSRDRAIEEIHSRACRGPAPEERGGITFLHTAVRTEIAHRIGGRCFTRRRYTILQKFR